MRNILLVILFSFYFTLVFCENYIFRIELTDKGNPPYTTDNPAAFLSEKSIERRQRQGITIDDTDLPINPTYLAEIKATGAEIKATSKWVKTVTVYLPDSSIVPALKQLNFVDTLYCVWKGTLPQPDTLESEQGKFLPTISDNKSTNIYGASDQQVGMLHVDLLHAAGFKGQGMSIAVLDAGFQNSDQIEAFNFNQIKEVKNFTHTLEDPLRYTQSHGTMVLSCMLANQPGVITGTAPESDYYLFISEVDDSEYPVEEDYWVAAIEYADSIGIDVVTSSLGYSTFNELPSMNHTHEQLDGQTILVSKAASMAGNKGMLVFCSAGNERGRRWEKIIVPSDADHIITVGAVNPEGIITNFSSRGPSADGRFKPDLCTLGEDAAIITGDGVVIKGRGTSYATPILAGAGACLWQALPWKSSKEIIALMRSVGSKYTNPDSDYGYGIPNIGKAYEDCTTEKEETSCRKTY